MDVHLRVVDVFHSGFVPYTRTDLFLGYRGQIHGVASLYDGQWLLAYKGMDTLTESSTQCDPLILFWAQTDVWPQPTRPLYRIEADPSVSLKMN